MDETKKLNTGKYRNKQRYKNKTKVTSKEPERVEKDKEVDKIIIEESPIFQKRNLESNWYRYEPKQEDDKDSSRDFSVLASAPISLGSYFQFKSDKNIVATQSIKQLDNALFQLNVDLLNLSLSSIPFHIQCEIDERYFSKYQLDTFKKEAQDNFVKYVAYLKSFEEEQRNEPKQAVQINNNEEIPKGANLNVQSDNIEKQPNEELEQWLEDILDD